MSPPQQIGSSRDVLESQLEKELLTRFAIENFLLYGRVVCGAVLDGVVEDRGIRRKPGHGELVDVTPKCPAAQQVSSDVVEPQALA